MYTAGSSTARKEIIRLLAKQGYGLNGTLLPRKNTIVLQKHDTLGCCLACDSGVGLEVGGVRGRILVETGGLHDIFEHTAHVAIHISHIEFTLFHTFDNLIDLCWLSGFHQIVACMYLANRGKSLADANPVGHHDAFKSPVVAQDLREQVMITHRVLTIHLVIRCHDGPRVALADGNLEAAQVEFTGSTLGDALIHTCTVGLLRVNSEVLG